jgi:hypothetical protein
MASPEKLNWATVLRHISSPLALPLHAPQPEQENELSENINDGGPAFPRITEIQTPNSVSWETPEYSKVRSTDGLSMRDYFAAKAMQALYARLGGSARCSAHDGGLDYLAQGAYEAADAMLKARTA